VGDVGVREGEKNHEIPQNEGKGWKRMDGNGNL